MQIVLRSYQEIECLAAGVRWSLPFIKDVLKQGNDVSETVPLLPHPLKRVKKVARQVQQVRRLRDYVEVKRTDVWDQVHAPISNWLNSETRDHELNLPRLSTLESAYERHVVRQRAANSQTLESLHKVPVEIPIPSEFTDLAVQGLRMVAGSPIRGYENDVDRSVAQELLQDIINLNPGSNVR